MIWDPNSTRTISASSQQQKTDFNIFEGLTCHGAPSVVINGGCVSVDEEGASITLQFSFLLTAVGNFSYKILICFIAFS